MNRPLSKMAVSAGVVLAGAAMLAGIAGPASATGAASAKHHRQVAKTWSFGVMADTQWTVPTTARTRTPSLSTSSGSSTRSSSRSTSSSSSRSATSPTTAVDRVARHDGRLPPGPLQRRHRLLPAARQPRDVGRLGAIEFLRVFPQTQTAHHEHHAGRRLRASPTRTPRRSPSRPSPARPSRSARSRPRRPRPTGFGGLCYAFDYGNARFVLLDQFTPHHRHVALQSSTPPRSTG